jgi:hypothetical protein
MTLHCQLYGSPWTASDSEAINLPGKNAGALSNVRFGLGVNAGTLVPFESADPRQKAHAALILAVKV